MAKQPCPTCGLVPVLDRDEYLIEPHRTVEDIQSQHFLAGNEIEVIWDPADGMVIGTRCRYERGQSRNIVGLTAEEANRFYDWMTERRRLAAENGEGSKMTEDARRWRHLDDIPAAGAASDATP